MTTEQEVNPLAARLDAVADLDEQFDEFQAVSEELEGEDDPTLLVPILRMLERVADADDFGVFHAYGTWIEELDPDAVVDGKTVAGHLIDSLRRAYNWKVAELAGMFVEDDDAIIAALRERLADDEISSSQYDAVVWALEDRGVEVEPEEEPAESPVEDAAPAPKAREWWDVDVRDGIADVWRDIDDERIQFLVDHPECLKDAVYAFDIHELDTPSKLLELDRLLIARSTYSDWELLEPLPDVREKLYGIHHNADYDGRLQQDLSPLEGLPELRLLDVGLSQVPGERFAELLSTLEKLEMVRVAERSQFAALDAIPHPELIRVIDASEVWGARTDEAPLTADEIAHLTRFENLERLDLSLDHLERDALGPLSDAGNLRVLRIIGATWPKPDWSFLQGTTALEEFANWRSGSIPSKSAQQLVHARNLRVFEVQNAKIGARGAATLAELPRLEVLSVGGITDRDMQHIGTLGGLKRLSLYNAKITDASVTTLSDLEDLEELTITKAPITDAAVDALPTGLRKLELTKIKGLTAAVAEKLARFPYLTELTVAGSSRSVTKPLETRMQERGGYFSDYA